MFSTHVRMVCMSSVHFLVANSDLCIAISLRLHCPLQLDPASSLILPPLCHSLQREPQSLGESSE